MTVYLIRHGKTLANEKRLYCGSTDLPLSEKGREELNGIHYDIKNARFLTSGMKRTHETL
jgi:alpha-ribazole phosphatase